MSTAPATVEKLYYWLSETDGRTFRYRIWTVQFHNNNIFSESNNFGNPLAQNPAPCAVCYVGGRSTILMIPARTQCPESWTTEYAGYLVSDSKHDANRHRSSYVCWDEAPEIAVGGTSQNHAVIYPVEVFCGTLPCSLYPTGKELTCVVCSKWQLHVNDFDAWWILHWCILLYYYRSFHNQIIAVGYIYATYQNNLSRLMRNYLYTSLMLWVPIILPLAVQPVY